MIPAAALNSNPPLIRRLDSYPVVRRPEQLRLHPALYELGWTGLIDEFNEAARPKNHCLPEPILITKDGTILAGFERWQLALFEGKLEIHCIEYPLTDDESLSFILNHHRPRRGWNAFVRIRLALMLEPYLQQQALDNMRTGGKYKGLANLPNVPIDVREEIASAAGVGPRNVSNVKKILEVAHPRLIAALRDGMLTINGAIQLCKLPQDEQLQQFIRNSEECATNKVIRRATARPKQKETSTDVVTVLEALQRQELQQPGSVELRVGRLQRTIILIGQDLLTSPYSQRELRLT